MTRGPNALKARLMLSPSTSSSSPDIAETGGVAPGERGKGIWVADWTGIQLGVGRGRPNAALWLGKEELCIGLDGGKEDFRCDSVRSEMSDVSSFQSQLI